MHPAEGDRYRGGGKANAVEVLEDLDRQLTPDVQPVAEIRRAGGAALAIQLADQVGKGDDPMVTVITVFDDSGDQPLLRRML